MSRNMFDYLEFALKRIFSLEGIKTLQTFAGPLLYSLVIFMIFYKVARVLKEAMRHLFLMEYYKDISNLDPILDEIRIG